MLNSKSGRVLSLVSQHPTNEEKFVVNDRTLEHIKQFNGNYCFISICGDYRSGKSFLLNSLFFDYSGFETSSSTESCTKGIKLWSQPIQYNGLYIWIVDTEGFGSIEKDSLYDGKIFLMNLLLSNIILYNSFGAIDQNSISKLAMICREAKFMDQSIAQTKLFWILRDFALQMADKEGKPLSSDQYLEECLRENSNNHTKSEKQFLRSLFKMRHCISLIRPVIDEQKLNSLKQINKMYLRQEFKQEISKLYHSLLQQADAKMINGVKIGSHNIDMFVRSFVEAVNSNAVDSNLNCTYEKIVEYQRYVDKEAIKQTITAKIQALNKILPVQQEHICYLRQQISKSLEQTFKEMHSHSSGLALELLSLTITTQTDQELLQLQNRNRRLVQQQLKQYLYRHIIELYPKFVTFNHQSFQQKYNEVMNRFRDDYNAKYSKYFANEKELDMNYCQFIQKQQKKIFCEIVKRWRLNQKENDQRHQELKRNKKTLDEEVKKAKQDRHKLEKIIDEMKREQSRNIECMKIDVEQTFKQEMRSLIQGYQHKIEQLTSKHEEKIKKLTADYESIEQERHNQLTAFQYQKQSLFEKLTLQKEKCQLLAIKLEQAKNNYEMQLEQVKNSQENKLKIVEMKYGQLQSTLTNERRKYQILSEERKIEETHIMQDLADKDQKIEYLSGELINLENKYKQELEKILMEEKDILCKTITSKINEYEYKCKIYQSRLQEYAVLAQERQFYENKSQELEIEVRSLKAASEEEQDYREALLCNIKKIEAELVEKEITLQNIRTNSQKEINLIQENLSNNKKYLKEMEERHFEEVQFYKQKLETQLKGQFESSAKDHEQTLRQNRTILQQKFEKERSQLKEIIRNNDDQIENLKMQIVALNNEIDKIYLVLGKLKAKSQHLESISQTHQSQARPNSYDLLDITESPEEQAEQIQQSSKKRDLQLTEFLAEEIYEIYESMRQEIKRLTDQRVGIKEDLRANFQEIESYEKLINRAKNELKHCKCQNEQLRKKLTQYQSSIKENFNIKEKLQSFQKQNSNLIRQLEFKQQMILNREQGIKESILMYKEAIANLTEENKQLAKQIKTMNESNCHLESELSRFKMWAVEVKSKNDSSQKFNQISDQKDMSTQKIRNLQNQIKRLAKKLQDEKLQKIEKTSRMEINVFSDVINENRINQIEVLRNQNQMLYKNLQQNYEKELKQLEQKKALKSRQNEQEQLKLIALKQEFDNYKRRSKETIAKLESENTILISQKNELKKQLQDLNNNILKKYQSNEKMLYGQIDDLQRERQFNYESQNKRINQVQEISNRKCHEADRKVAQAELRLEQYKQQIEKDHNRIILQSERNRLKYEHLLKVNGELIKEIEALKSKAHQITLKQKYKSKISSLFND